ncbi:MAG: OmpH family outer membrane protein [Candidatus Sumerlaeaceae bacterium]|nr:OmpH family outer membrane protein [Candidatus Sumerlaeaceae bacterium]
MKKFAAITVLTTLLALATSFAAAETRVGYVDVDKVVSKSKKITNILSGLEDQVRGFQGEMQKKIDTVKGLDADIKRGEGVLSADEISKKKKEKARLENEIDDLNLKAQKAMREADSTKYEPLMKEILFTIQDVAKEKKLDIVLRGEAVLYGSTAVDISNDVIERLAQKDSGNPDSTKAAPTATPELRATATPEITPTMTPEPKATPAPTAELPVFTPAPTPAETPAPAPEESKAPSTPKPTATKKPTPKPDSKTKATATPKPRGSRPVDRQAD